MRDGFESLRCGLAVLQQEKVPSDRRGRIIKKLGWCFGVFKIRWLGSRSGIDNFDVYFRLQPFGDENAFRFSVEAMELRLKMAIVL